MRKLVTVAIVIIMGFWTVGCAKKSQESFAGKILKGEHCLRKMMEKTEVNSKISGSFFLLGGSFSGETEEITSVKFAWKMNDGTYAISSLPLEKIRVKFDETATTPTIKFRWLHYDLSECPTQYLMNNQIFYAVITVKEKDWPTQINLPLNDLKK